MRLRLSKQSTSCCQECCAFTILELLIVMAISSILIAIVLPSLSAARETAHISRCLANLRELSATSFMYIEDEGFSTQPWHLGFEHATGQVDQVSEFIYGGFQTETIHPIWGSEIDVHEIHTGVRPYNRYIAPGLCQATIGTYICPSDRFTATPFFESPCSPPVISENDPSWMINGNSYAMNWNWLNAKPWGSKADNYVDIDHMSSAGRELLHLKVGAAASRFVLFTETPMNAYMQDARPPDGSDGESCMQMLGEGWHKRYSRYSMGFLDGHAEHRFIDTRYSKGPGYDTWPENFTLPGF